jgi:hypothetical protein
MSHVQHEFPDPPKVGRVNRIWKAFTRALSGIFLKRDPVWMDFNHKVVVAWFNTGLAIVVAFIAYSYYDRQAKLQESNGRLERTLKILHSGPEDNDQRLAMFDLFADRWTVPPGTPLPRDDAVDFSKKCTRPRDFPEICDRWNVARKHLNEIEPIAFAYVHNLGDSRILAASTCVYIARSFRYFEQLIEAFRELYGNGHSWQVIKQAVTGMEGMYDKECKALTGLEPNKVSSK